MITLARRINSFLVDRTVSTTWRISMSCCKAGLGNHSVETGAGYASGCRTAMIFIDYSIVDQPNAVRQSRMAY